MEASDFRKYVIPVTSGVVLNVIASYLYEFLKPYTANARWYPVLFGVTIVAGSLGYTVFLIRYVKQQGMKEFVLRTEYHHSFAHTARNLAVKLMKRKPLPPRAFEGEEPISLTGNSHYLYKEEVVILLDSLASMFQQLAPKDAKVWACIRERRTDDCYYTWARSGGCNTTRQEFSEPLRKDSETIANLKKSYKENMDCVIITGSKNKDWTNMRNDHFGEDLSVLMGAVLSKSWSGLSFDDPKLHWIVCVNANRENVFSRDCIPLMKACNDIFSWILNSFIRYDADKNEWPEAILSRTPSLDITT
jgi:hypothetical protein